MKTMKEILSMSYEALEEYLSEFSTTEISDLADKIEAILCDCERKRGVLKKIKSILSDRE